MNRTTIVCIVLILFSLAGPEAAYAYLDPGTGSILLQALAAAAIGAGVFWRRILGFFKKMNSAGRKSKDMEKK